MNVLHQEPNWGLVTDHYKEPQTFADLLSLLIPQTPKGDSEDRAVLAWKEKEFYKEENIIPLIHYALDKIEHLPKFHKDEILTILRIVRLCQEVKWYEEAYRIMNEQKLIQFVKTSMAYDEWDLVTKVVAWNYLIVKRKVSELEQEDTLIWERVKFDEEWIHEYESFLSNKLVLDFMFFYICKQAKFMNKSQLDEGIMNLAVYCNTYIYDIYIYGLTKKYKKCIEFLAYYEPSRAVLACQRAVFTQLADMIDSPVGLESDDFVFEIKEMIQYMDLELIQKYELFLGKLLSYIPFFEMIKVQQQVYYFEELIYICKGIGYKEDLLRHYIFSQFSSKFALFIRPFLKYKRYAMIHEILFYWCTTEQRKNLEARYNLNFIYEQYACG
ncbi:DUF3965 domain-containing protein [Microbacteriaceae bacterium 4G12]